MVEGHGVQGEFMARKVSSLVANCSIDVKTRGRVCEACARPALLYGPETWEPKRQTDGCPPNM